MLLNPPLFFKTFTGSLFNFELIECNTEFSKSLVEMFFVGHPSTSLLARPRTSMPPVAHANVLEALRAHAALKPQHILYTWLQNGKVKHNEKNKHYSWQL